MEALARWNLELVVYPNELTATIEGISGERSIKHHCSAPSEHEARRNALERAHANNTFIRYFTSIKRRPL